MSLSAQRVSQRVGQAVGRVVARRVVDHVIGQVRARSRWPAARRSNGLVADVAYGADQRFVLRPELGAQSSHMHVHGAGAAEEVVTPHFLEQLRSSENTTGVLSQIL